MKYLIDTHIFIWSLTADSKISSHTEQILLDIENEIYLSIESLREIAIKHRDGKLDLPDNFQNIMTSLRKKSWYKTPFYQRVSFVTPLSIRIPI